MNEPGFKWPDDTGTAGVSTAEPDNGTGRDQPGTTDTRQGDRTGTETNGGSDVVAGVAGPGAVPATDPTIAPAEDIDGNPIGGAIAPSDVPTEHMTLQQALESGVVTEAEVKERLAAIHVEAGEKAPSEEDKAKTLQKMLVYRCKLGHEQHGPAIHVVKSTMTGQVLYQSPPVCMVCMTGWIGKAFPTKLVETAGMKAERIAREGSQRNKRRVERKRIGKALKKARRR